MSEDVQSETIVSELDTLLIPACGRQLVLPNVSVAEVIPFIMPFGEKDVPNWFLGKFKWRNTDVPLVSFEAINDEPFSSTSRDRRIALLNGLVMDARLPFCGLLVDGVPKLTHLSPAEIIVDENNEPGPAESVRVLVNGEAAVIPNVDYIQQEVLKYLK